jgi:hypothetical protein
LNVVAIVARKQKRDANSVRSMELSEYMDGNRPSNVFWEVQAGVSAALVLPAFAADGSVFSDT